MKETGKLSRRNLLQGASAIAAAGALGAANALAADQLPASNLPGSGGKPRALALIGDRYHNQNDIRIALNRVFRELGISIDYTTNYYDLSAGLLKPYQLFVGLRDDMIWPGGYLQTAIPGPSGLPSRSPGEDPGVFPPEKAEYWISEEQGKAVKDFVASGNSFYSYHNNAFVSRSSKNYREVQGGWALSHPPLRPFKVKIVNKNHPITQGVEDFMVTDEQHYLVYEKDPKNILLQSENIDGLTFTPSLRDPDQPDAPSKDVGTGSVSGWAHEYGKGRVVFTAMGHTIDAMWQPEYLKIQKNAVRWLLRMS
ncbi:MAG TPA: ThuA domain-containing protein [Granulicella sp.]